jgi:hypothetical protein
MANMATSLTENLNKEDNVPTSNNDALTQLLGNLCATDGSFKYANDLSNVILDTFGPQKTEKCGKDRVLDSEKNSTQSPEENNEKTERKRTIDMYVSPPKTPPPLKRTKKITKNKKDVNTDPDGWITRDAQKHEKDPKILDTTLARLRRSPIHFRYPVVRFYERPVNSDENAYIRDQRFRLRTLDQLDFLFRLGISCQYYLKTHGYLSKVKILFDNLNKCIHFQIKSSFLNNTAIDKDILSKTINIEECGVLEEIIAIILGLYKLQEKSTLFKQVREDLINSHWFELPSDYSNYISKYMTVAPHAQNHYMKGSSLF